MGVKRGKRRRGGEGCLYLLSVCVTACTLLVINAVVVRALYGFLPADPEIFAHPRLGRAVMFVAPIMLLVVEWMLIDRLLDLLSKSADD